jgi:integrase
MKRRHKGEGTIRKRSDGSYEARYVYNGKQRSIYGNDEEELRQRLKKILAEITLDTYKEPTKMKFKEWLDIWLWDYKAKNIKPLTFEQYERIIRLYIRPKLGHVKLIDLTNIQIQTEINRLGKNRTAQLTATMYKMILRQAVRSDLLPKNPAEYIITPKKKKASVTPLNAKEKQMLMKAMSGHRLGIAFYILLSTGMRRGELLALKWQDIDFKHKLIRINKSYNRVKVFENKKDEGKYKNIENTTKTEKGNRIFPALEDTIKMLNLHRNKQIIEKVKAKIYDDSDYVFCSRQGKVINPRNFTKYFYKFLADNGIDRTNLHNLRHTFATTGIENGIDMKAMQELLGHSTMQVTSEIYTHYSQDKKRSEINKLKGIL